MSVTGTIYNNRLRAALSFHQPTGSWTKSFGCGMKHAERLPEATLKPPLGYLVANR